MKEKSLILKWIYASKVKSWPKILVPFVLGNALGISNSDAPSWTLFIIGGIATILGVIFIVLMNDWGDQKVDKIKRDMFPEGCSPKTIPDKILTSKSLLMGGVIAGVLSFILISLLGFTLLDKTFTIYYAIISCMVFIAYTLPPIKLNYRGGGEFLEMLGVGLVLPSFMAYLQSGLLLDYQTLLILIPFTLFAFTSAIASGFSDEESDRIGGKHTIVTTVGNAKSHQFLHIIFLIGALLSLVSIVLMDNFILSFSILIAQIPLWLNYFKSIKWKKLAITNAFKEQAIFKKYLHYSIWSYGIFISFAAITEGIVH